jgi:hypothetical protein
MSVSTITPNRLLKKAHLRSPSLRLGTRPLGHSLRRTGSTPGPTCGGYPVLRAPSGIWTFLSSLGESGFFSSLLGAVPRDSQPFVRAQKLRAARAEAPERRKPGASG